jgi:hypothetical protein
MNHLSEYILMEFADGLLQPEKQNEAEMHLAACSSCREELEMYRSVSLLLEKENLVKAPPSMTNLVMQQVELHQHIMLRKKKSRRTAFRFAGIMLGFLGALFGLGLMIDHGTGSVIQIPTYIVDALNYIKGLEFTIKNPLILYVAVSVMILLISERIIRAIKPRKISV